MLFSSVPAICGLDKWRIKAPGCGVKVPVCGPYRPVHSYKVYLHLQL